MQVDFFEIENKPEAQEMVMPWPLNFCAFNIRGDMLRIYYVVAPGATEQHGTFYCVNSEQVLPETFPARLLVTLFPAAPDFTLPDDAVHLFFETPVKKVKKPRAVKTSDGQKIKGGANENGNGAANDNS